MSSSVQPPAFLRAETAETYSASICITADGLTFLLRDAATDSQHCIELPLEAGYPDLSNAVGELFFRHPFLCYPYKHTTICYRPSAYVLAPLDLYEEGRGDVWLSSVLDKEDRHSAGEQEILVHRFETADKVLLAAYDKALLQFLRRTLLVVEPVPYFVPLLDSFARSSAQPDRKTLFFFLHPEGMDAILIDKQELAFAIHYPLMMGVDTDAMAEEMLFYLFSLWRSLGLEAEKDLLRIVPQKDLKHDVGRLFASLVEGFVRHVELL